MTVLTIDQVSLIRSWVGEVVTTDELQERFDRLASIDKVIEETLRYRLGILVVDEESSVRLPSGLAVNTSKNIDALTDRLALFLSSGGTEEDESVLGSGVFKLDRTDYR